MARRPGRERSRFLATRVLLYLLPGLLAATGALVALVSAERITTIMFALTAVLVVLGFGVPPLVDWLRARHLRDLAQKRLLTRRRDDAASVRAAHLRDHFEPRGRGVLASSVRTGTYFTGRVRVLQQLAVWMAELLPVDSRARIVTGGPGSGKSAVLGRLVSLANPQPHGNLVDAGVAARRPAAGALTGVVNIAVHARARTVDEVATDVAHALDIDAAGVAGLLTALRQAPRPAVVIVDAVDEAADPYRLIVELLEPMASAAERTRVRLIVGCRRGGDDALLRLFGSSAVVLDLDDPVFLDRNDVEEYVRRILLAEQDPRVPTPYRERPAQASAVARAVAARARESYLVAQLTALALAASREPIATVDPNWTETFPDTVGAAMERYLRDIQPGGPWLRDLLLALAWSEGDGVDDPQTWAALATALGTADYTEHDVTRLLLDTPAVDLLHRTDRSDRIAFRLFHEALSEHLRQQSGRHRPPAETQRRFTEVLIARAPRLTDGRPDWRRADLYTRTYLSVHAAAGRVLDDLLDDAGFLATAEPSRLLASLPSASSDRGRQVARTVERVGQQLLLAAPAEQVCYLEMAAHMSGDRRLARQLAMVAPDRSWSVLWAHWEVLDDGWLLGHHDDYVVAVSTVDSPGGTLVVSASAWAVRAWRLADGRPVAAATREPHKPIVDMVAFADAEHVIVLTLHADGELRRTVLGTTDPPEVLSRARDPQGLWLISYAGHRGVVCVSTDHNVEVLSVLDGQPLVLPAIPIGDGRVLNADNTSGRNLVVVAGAQANVITYDLGTGQPFGESFRPSEHLPRWEEPEPMWTGALAKRDGSLVVYAGGPTDGPVVAWNLLQGVLVREAHYTLGGALAMLACRTPAGDVLCWGDAHGDLYMSEADNVDPQRIAAHDNGIDALASCQLHGGTALVTGGRDGAVRVWHLGTRHGSRSPNRYHNIALVRDHDSRTLVACVRSDGVCPIFDAANGGVVAELTPPEGARLRNLAALPGTPPTLVTADSHSRIAIWRPPSRQPVRTFEITDGDVRSIVVAKTAPPVLLAALADGHLAFIDLNSGEPARAPIPCHSTPFVITVDPEQPDDALRFVTSTWSWKGPAETRYWTVTGDKTTYRDLPLEPDPETGQPYGVSQVAFSRLNRRRIAVAVGGGSNIHVWNLDDGSLLIHAQLQRTHRMALNTTAIGELAGRRVALCSGYTCSLGLWPLDSQEESHLWIGSPLWSIESLPGDRVIMAGARGIMAMQLTKPLPGHRTEPAATPSTA